MTDPALELAAAMKAENEWLHALLARKVAEIAQLRAEVDYWKSTCLDIVDEKDLGVFTKMKAERDDWKAVAAANAGLVDSLRELLTRVVKAHHHRRFHRVYHLLSCDACAADNAALRASEETKP